MALLRNSKIPRNFTFHSVPSPVLQVEIRNSFVEREMSFDSIRFNQLEHLRRCTSAIRNSIVLNKSRSNANESKCFENPPPEGMSALNCVSNFNHTFPRIYGNHFAQKTDLLRLPKRKAAVSQSPMTLKSTRPQTDTPNGRVC